LKMTGGGAKYGEILADKEAPVFIDK
jgi:hypothetical protein